MTVPAFAGEKCAKLGEEYMRETDNAMRKIGSTGIPVLSFFTGAGFLDIGFIDSGFNVVWFNEVSETFAHGFCHGMTTLYGKPPTTPRIAPIESLSKHEILREAFGTMTGPDVFGVIGGPPCPDFSVAGTNAGFSGENGRLSRVFVDLIIQLRPTFFVLENVPGILRTKKHRAHFDALRGSLERLYQTELLLLNALEYGVPQDRQRVFMIGFLRMWLKRCRSWLVIPETARTSPRPSWFPLPAPPYKNAKHKYRWPGVEPLGAIPKPPPDDIPKVLMVDTHLHPSKLAGLKNTEHVFKPRSDKIWRIREGDVSGKSFKRLHRYRFSPTAAYGNNEVHLNPYEPRRLSVREAMRIQSVPDEYVLPSDLSLTDMFKMVSNGVPVTLARVVATAVAYVVGDIVSLPGMAKLSTAISS